MIENQPNEITLIYHSEKPDDKKARAYAESITGFVVKTLDLKKEDITETQIAEIAEKMNVEVYELTDPGYIDRLPVPENRSIRGIEASELLVLMSQEPIIIGTPILIIGKKAFRYDSSFDLIAESMAVGVESTSAANIQEKPDRS